MRLWFLGVLLGGCAAAFGQTDAFPEQLQAGCSTEADCERLVAEARSREARCKDNTIGYIRCSDARGDTEIAQSLLKSKVDARTADEASALQRHRELVEYEEQQHRTQKDLDNRAEQARYAKIEQDSRDRAAADRAAKDAAAAKIVEEQNERLRLLGPDGRATELRQCLHNSTEGCDALLSQLLAVAVDDKEKASLVKLDQKLRGDLQAKQDQSVQQGRSAPSQDYGGGLVCGDGSVSGCPCGGSHRGCCSHHGGVAGCR